MFTYHLQGLRSFQVVINWICNNIVLSFLEVSPCELHCTPKGLFGLYFSKKLADQVHDGTRCAPGKRDVCINGKCEVCNKVNYLVVIFSFRACRSSLQAADLCLFFLKHVGCDNVLHSNAKEDKCGVCRGDGTACETVKSTFNQRTGIGKDQLIYNFWAQVYSKREELFIAYHL